MLRILILIVITALLSSCAKPPYEQLDAAEFMVEKAYLAQAMEFAPTEYIAARTALNDANQAMQDKDYSDAEASIEFALTHARRAVTLSEEGRAKKAEEDTRRIREEEALRAAEQKTRAEQTTRKAKASKPKPKPAQKPEPEPKVVPVANYDVRDGETLWTISAQPQVYNEGLLWPLLYKSNRDQIKDPRQIFPGQTLSVRRDMTNEELEEARQTAQESNIFPVP